MSRAASGAGVSFKMKGPSWVSARVRVPEKGSPQAGISFMVGKDRSSACLVLSRFSDGTVSWSGGYGLASKELNNRGMPPEGRYVKVRLDSSRPPGPSGSVPSPPTPAPTFSMGEGTDRPARTGPGAVQAGCSGGVARPASDRQDDVYDVVLMAASDGVIGDVQMSLTPPPGGKILNVSHGSGTWMAREWDFRNGVVVSAGDAWTTPVFAVVEASSMTAASLTRSFSRSAVAVFMTSATTWVAPAGTYGPPALVSIEGPGGTGTVNLQPLRYLSPVPVPVWQNSDWKANVWMHYMVGEPPGSYLFKVEHATGAMLFAGVQGKGTFVSTEPYVLLAGADADVPACSVFRHRTTLPSGTILCS